MKQPQVLVTGAAGFIGEAVVFKLLIDRNFTPIAAVRSKTRLEGLCRVVRWDLNHSGFWGELQGVEVLVHCAARVHVMRETASDALTEYRKVNVEDTLRLAKNAASAGVRRFIYISSIKVNGEVTESGLPFTTFDFPAPCDSYGISKQEAEEGLREISLDTGMELVIIRPPLVYGPGVKGNFLNMMSWLDKGWPLPLGAIHNQRSLVSVGNLVDLIITCIDHPAAVGHVFMVSDGEDLSTTQLLKGMSDALGRRYFLLPIPTNVVRLVGAIAGRRKMVQRLCSSLQVDIRETCTILNWTPPVDSKTALRQTADHYLRK